MIGGEATKALYAYEKAQNIRSIVSSVGIDNERKIQHISLNKKEKIKFEHDIVITSKHQKIKAIGQLKTSSKDRLDKIFRFDKFLVEDVWMWIQ